MSKKRVSRVTDNFNRIARDLDRALRVARFEIVDRFLIDEARELSWSFASDKARPFRFNFSSISRLTGLDRTGLGRRCRSLIERRVFLDLGDGSLLINKEYPEWFAPPNHEIPPDHTPRYSPDNRLLLLSKESIAWCLKVASDLPTADPSHQVGLNDCSELRIPVISFDGPVITACGSGSAGGADPSHQAHIQRTRAESFLIEKLNTGVPSETPPRHAGAGAREGEKSPIPNSNPHACNDPAEVARIGEYAIKLFGALDAGPKVSGYAHMYPIAWIREAIESAGAAGRLRWDYINGILRRMEREGGPTAPTSAPGVNGHAPRKSGVLAKQEAQIAEWKKMAEEARQKENQHGDG